MIQNPLSDPWQQGELYEQYVGRWSRQVAPRFLAWLDFPAGKKWLDVGCGTGALSAAILAGCSPGSVTGVEPSQGFIHLAQANLLDRVKLIRGTATAIPLNPSSVNVTVSGLVLNFVPDPLAALCEMVRVTATGGVVGGYVWDYAGKMEFMRIFWETASEIDPQAARMNEGSRFPLCNPQALSELFAGSGLSGVDVTAIDIPTVFRSFEDYWQPFLGGNGPAPAYVVALDNAARDRLRERLRQRIPAEVDGSISLVARAWAVRGSVA